MRARCVGSLVNVSRVHRLQDSNLINVLGASLRDLRSIACACPTRRDNRQHSVLTLDGVQRASHREHGRSTRRTRDTG